MDGQVDNGRRQGGALVGESWRVRQSGLREESYQWGTAPGSCLNPRNPWHTVKAQNEMRWPRS